MKTYLKNYINGTIQMGISLYWIWTYGRLMYLYKNSDILWLLMFPDWILIFFMFLGVIGLLIGFSVFIKRRKIKIGYFQLIGLFIIGSIVNILVTW